MRFTRSPHAEPGYAVHDGEAPGEDWRDPWVFADPGGDGWHMLITARSATGSADGNGVIGHARSRDLVGWEVGPPLTDPGHGFGDLEVPQLAFLNTDEAGVFIGAISDPIPVSWGSDGILSLEVTAAR